VSLALDQAAKQVGDRDLSHDLEKLRDLARDLESIRAETFSKYQRLLDTLRREKWKPRDSKDRLVIFTERRETLAFLREHLPDDLKLKEEQVRELHGGLSDMDQQAIVEEFGNTRSKVRLLLATDVASEGLNLHYLCHRLVHFDIPWSLMVFQQRNGRIDRYGQDQAPQITYLLTRSEVEKIQGDHRILEILINKRARLR